MPKGDKYIGLTNYLENIDCKSITMSFNDIEKQIGTILPQSAYSHKAFWSNTYTHSVAYGWLNAGFKTVNIDLENRLITFEKNI